MVTGGSQRGQWSSKIGFIFAAAGSAIGLGNIWRFPYITGENGGAAFILLYLLCVVLICLPYMFAELALGRATQRNPVGAIRAIRPGSLWVMVGVLGVLTGLFILSFYAVVAGWAFGYIFKTLFSHPMPFGEFIASPGLAIGLTAAFLVLTILVVYGGVQGGIERWSKLLMPVLFVLLIILIIRSVTLPGSGAGLEFLLKPDFSKLTGKSFLAALGQAFFSLSLGMGLMITYGSYLSKNDNMVTSGLWVAVFDTLIALLAGFMIFPALFAFGKQPDAGPTLIFIVLPELFQQMPLGNIIGALFFLLLSIAALTSTISLLEVPVAYVVDELGWPRKYTVWIGGGVAFLLSLPSALSQGAVPALGNVGGMDFLSLMSYLWGDISLALGGLLLCIFVAWVWGISKAAEEIQRGSAFFQARPLGLPFTNAQLWGFFIRYICPVFIFIVLLNVFGVFD
ncbi:MAG: sodium-dependent transporter [Calditrichaeota bacterium]|nr:MAG: sodium-dependent transporter [Calditrichota bacterium]